MTAAAKAVEEARLAAGLPPKPRVASPEAEALLAIATSEREAGNDEFRAGRVQEAISRYSAALAHAAEALAAAPAVAERAKTLQAAVCGNLAACHLQTGDFDEAVRAASRCLELDPSNVKALFRRAAARRKRGDLEAALEDATAALRLEPANASVRQEAELIRRTRKQAPKSTGKVLFSKMFQQMQGFASDGRQDPLAGALHDPFYLAAPSDTVAACEEGGVHPTLALLRREVQELREVRPLGLAAVSEPWPVPTVNARTGDEEVTASPDGGRAGPWLVELRVHGPKAELEAHLPEPGAYDSDFLVELCVPPSYPDVPPRARFRSLIHHSFIEGFEEKDRQHERRLGRGFFRELERCARQSPGTAGAEAGPAAGTSPAALKFSLWSVCELLGQMLDGRVPLPAGADPQAWQSARSVNKTRLGTIHKYRSLMRHPEVYDGAAGWRWEWLDPALATALRAEGLGGEASSQPLRGLLEEVAPGVFAFDLFTPAFCELFLAELDNFYSTGLPARRPNSMNNYGVVLNDIGWEHMANALQRLVLQPIAALLYPNEGAQLDSHHSFVVRYKVGEDRGLDMHVDDSDVTFNVCLGRSFSGCGLVFCGVLGAADHRHLKHRYFHRIGRCVVHLGRQRHGADDITEGERLNLIVWNHSIAWRASRAHLERSLKRRGFAVEAGPPDKECLSYTHDRDFGVFRSYPAGREGYRGQGWCPPTEAEYSGFQAEAAGPVPEGTKPPVLY